MRVDEGVLREVDTSSFGRAGMEVEVEVLQGAGVLEAGAAHAQFELLAVAAFDFGAWNAIEKLAV